MPHVHGEGTEFFWKVAKNFGQYAFSQHAKLNMASFVLYLPVCFGLRFRMVEVCSKAPGIELFTLEEK